MKPGLRESFKGFWSRPDRAMAWAWAFERMSKESEHFDVLSEESRLLCKLSLKCLNRYKTHYARNQTKEL